MGSNVLIGVLFLVLLFGFINSSLNHKEDFAAINTYGYVKYIAARDIARSAINISLKNRELYSGFNVSGNLNSGTYSVISTTINDTTFRLIAIGKFPNQNPAYVTDSAYVIKTTLQAYPKPFPTIGAAVTLHIDTLGAFDLNPGGGKKKIEIDGWDHNENGDSATLTGGVPGVAVMNPYDSSFAITGGDTVHIRGTPTDMVVNPNLTDPSDYIDLYIDAADNRLVGSGTYAGNGYDWGTSSTPKITYISSIDTTQEIHITGNIDGWGVLVLNGNVKFNGNLTFHGLVLLYGTSIMDVEGLGDAKIIGALVMGGPNGSTFQMNGSAEVLYSSSALRKASLIGKLLAYRVIDWYEQ